MLSQNEIKELFTYYDGMLYWKIDKKKSGAKVGDIAGSQNSWRTALRIGDKVYRSHRLIWVMFNGDIPKGLELDHIDFNKSNNRIENLRLATRQQNLFNRPVMAKTKSGVKGVFFNGKKWVASMTLNRVINHLGCFNTKEEAANTYREMAIKIHGEFARF